MNRKKETKYYYQLLCNGYEVPKELRTNDIPKYVYTRNLKFSIFEEAGLLEGDIFISPNPELDKEYFLKIGSVTYTHIENYKENMSQNKEIEENLELEKLSFHL